MQGRAMDAEQLRDGHWHFRLGPVERMVIVVVLAAFVSLLGWMGKSFAARLDSQKDSLDQLVTQQAVTSAQLTTLSTQLADVPALTSQMAELRVRVDNHDEALKELRQVRGLR